MTTSPGPAPRNSTVTRAVWLRENWRRWLKWDAAATAGFALLALAGAAAWAATLPDGVGAALIWIWASITAFCYLVAAALILVNATARAPGWLAIPYALLSVGIGVVQGFVFVAAVAVTSAGDLVVALWLAFTVLGTIVAGIGLLWPGILALQVHREARAAKPVP